MFAVVDIILNNILGAVIVSIFGTIITFIVKDYLKSKKDYAEKTNKEIGDIKSYLTTQQKAQEIVRQASLLLLKNELIKLYKKYKANGFVQSDIEYLNNIYDAYKSLGGNGYAENLAQKMKCGVR
jgi:uncharacterized membrane protein YhiD involved in acid resistance